MLTGRVNSRLEAVVRLWIRGPEGDALETEAIVDTGFNGTLCLPKAIVARLGLISRGHMLGSLADGSEVLFPVFKATVLWHGHPQETFVSAVDSVPLLGMTLLQGSELAMQVVEGGEVAIHELPVS